MVKILLKTSSVVVVLTAPASLPAAAVVAAGAAAIGVTGYALYQYRKTHTPSTTRCVSPR